ncbi:MAG TPA: tetratricopeptide repeat protein, partial [Tepidisphaeraceae bacterium]
MPLCFAAVSRRVVLSAFLALAAEPLLAADDSAAPAQALLAEGKAEEALTLCTAGLAKDATNVALLHTAAEASIALKQPAKAIGFLERAFAAAPKDRSVVHNLARSLYRADAQPRAIKLVRDHLAAHPKVLDEPLLDQLLYMIASADEPTRKLKAVADAAAFAEQYTKSLEAQRPGERRWGATWRPAQEVVELE